MNHHNRTPSNSDPLGVMGVTVGLAEIILVLAGLPDAPSGFVTYMLTLGILTFAMGVVLLVK